MKKTKKDQFQWVLFLNLPYYFSAFSLFYNRSMIQLNVFIGIIIRPFSCLELLNVFIFRK